MALRNRGNFLRWSDTASETLWNRYTDEQDCLVGTPIMIPGETYTFYVNTRDRVTLPSGTNYLKTQAGSSVATNPISVTNIALNSPIGGNHSYGTITCPAVADGLYYFQVGTWISNIIEVCSSPERTLLITFSNKSALANVFYEYAPNGFQQKFRIRGYVKERQPFFKGSEREESVTGLTRNYNQHLRGFRIVIFENLNDEAHEAAAVMFAHSNLEINGHSVQPKIDGAYKPLLNEWEPYSDGEFQVWDDEFGILNVC